MQLVKHVGKIVVRFRQQLVALFVNMRDKALEHERQRQQLLRYAVVQLARDALALVLLSGDDARKLRTDEDRVLLIVGAFLHRDSFEIHEVVGNDVQIAQGAVQIVDDLAVRRFVPIAHRAERAQQHGDHAPVARERQRAEAMQILGEHDRVRRVLARVDLLVDVREHHGLARLDGDAADAVPRCQHDAAMALAGSACAVYPLERRADERRQPDRHEIEPVPIFDVVHRTRVLLARARQLPLAEIGRSHCVSPVPVADPLVRSSTVYYPLLRSYLHGAACRTPRRRA